MHGQHAKCCLRYVEQFSLPLTPTVLVVASYPGDLYISAAPPITEYAGSLSAVVTMELCLAAPYMSVILFQTDFAV